MSQAFFTSFQFSAKKPVSSLHCYFIHRIVVVPPMAVMQCLESLLKRFNLFEHGIQISVKGARCV